MNIKLPCQVCSSKEGYLSTQSHYQCLECKRVIDDCCSGEIAGCNSKKNYNNLTNKNFKTCQLSILI